MLQPEDPAPIPESTRQVTQAAFPEGSVAMTLRDHLGLIFADTDFAALYPTLGQPAATAPRRWLISLDRVARPR